MLLFFYSIFLFLRSVPANLNVLPIIYYVTSIKCIKVIDKFVKSGPVMDRYCGRYGSCDEGTHVMCRYYDPNNRFGPMCHDPYTNITLNEDQKEFILAVVNEVRSRIALGGDKLRDGSMLPQGYGVMSVAWDDELAEFAQLWANQCIEGYDLCRATSKFPDPGQYMIKNRFQYYTWVPVVYKNTKFNDPHYISAEKINYVAYMTIRRSYHDALQAMSPDIIEQNSGEDVVVASVPAINFLFGMQTHIGCGVSAFKDYEYAIDFMYHERYRRIRNVVLLICNYSERLPKHGKLYYTEPPEGTDVCGCPPGWSGDASCLCREDCDTHCKMLPDIAILPIFKFEDAPPRKFTKYRNYDENKPDSDIFEVKRDPIIESQVKNFDIAEAELNAQFKNKTKKDVDGRKFFNVNKPIHNGNGDDENIQTNPVRYSDVDRNINELHYSHVIDEDIFDLLNKLDNEVENIEIGETEKEEIHENVASIYKILTDIPGEQHYENSDGRRHEPANYQQFNHNSAIQSSLNDGTYYNQNIQYYWSPNVAPSNFRNTYDITQSYQSNKYFGVNNDNENVHVDKLQQSRGI